MNQNNTSTPQRSDRGNTPILFPSPKKESPIKDLNEFLSSMDKTMLGRSSCISNMKTAQTKNHNLNVNATLKKL